MHVLLDSLFLHWCPALLLAIALSSLGALWMRRHRQIRWFTPLFVFSIALAVASIGGLICSPRFGGWLLVSAAVAFVGLFLILAVSGAWWRWLAYSVAVLALLGAGGLWLNAIGAGILEIAHDLRGLTFLHPWWLFLLLLVPLFFVLSAPQLNRSEPRPWIALGLRSAGVICLSLALAEPQLRQPNDHVTVLFVVDRSKSIPEELVEDASGKKVDHRERRIRRFLNQAVAERGAGHERDRAGLIVFGRRPRLELPPSDAPRFNLTDELPLPSDGDHTDIAAALKLDLASFADDTGKRIVLISDGDPVFAPQLLAGMKKDKVTVTTVGVACHGPQEDQKMSAIAKATGGRAYSVKDPRQLPAIYIKESRLVSQSFIHEKPFTPIVRFRSGPTDRLPEQVPPLRGFVRTTPKGSPLVEVPMQTPPFADQEFPLLAYWHYGLGKAVAFTSDAGDPRFWSRDWTQAGAGQGALYAKFWEQVIDWSLCPTESRRLNMITEYRDGKIRILVDARTDDGRSDIHLKLRGGITPPKGKGDEPGHQKELRFVQTNSGQYEAEVKAEEAGSYFLNAQAVRTKKVKGHDGRERELEEGVDSVRAGLTLPYSPEFAELASNTSLLDRLRRLTGGDRYEEDEILLAETAKSGSIFRPAPERVKSLQPLWYWLVFLSAVLLLSDVAVRRLAIDPQRLAERSQHVWPRLRGLPVPEPRQKIAERLQMRYPTRTTQERSEARYESEAMPTSGPPRGAETTSTPLLAPTDAPSAAPPPGAAPPQAETDDYASRLLKAKRKALDERKKDEPK